MPLYRKRPVVIEAHKWTNHAHPPAGVTYWADKHGNDLAACQHCGKALLRHGLIDTLEGADHIVCPGDWVITGIKGEKYACKSDVFLATYDPALDGVEATPLNPQGPP